MITRSTVTEATKFSYEADTLRSMQEALETQLKSLKARLAQSVSKSEWEAEVVIGAKLREELRLLQKSAASLEPIKGLLEALAAPPSISHLRATELVLAVRSLQRGGVVETTELIKTLATRALPVSPSDLQDMVLALDGPPARSSADVNRILRAMGSRWKSEEVELLLQQCQGMDHLQEILGATRQLEGILMQEKVKRVAAQDELHTLMHTIAPGAPTFEPPGAKFTGAVAITIIGENKSDTIYATADGSHPTTAHYQVRSEVSSVCIHTSRRYVQILESRLKWASTGSLYMLASPLQECLCLLTFGLHFGGVRSFRSPLRD